MNIIYCNKLKFSFKLVIASIFLFSTIESYSQYYYGTGNPLYQIEIDEAFCSCSYTEIGPSSSFGGLSFCPDPDGTLYAWTGTGLYELDINTGAFNLILPVPAGLPN
ncbi:MAG: hypothetical protein WBB31_11015, partial [Saprospiraceae bacterium]